MLVESGCLQKSKKAILLGFPNWWGFSRKTTHLILEFLYTTLFWRYYLHTYEDMAKNVNMTHKY